MDISTTFFCDHCGAANVAGAASCCFCQRPLALDATETTSSAFSLSSAEENLPGLSGGTLPVDTLLGSRYRVIGQAGQGGMGTVYRAQDTQLNDRIVAVKELRVGDSTSKAGKEALAAFHNEATLLAGLHHPNLPAIFEYFTEHGRSYLVMNFIQGETLEAYLTRTKRKKLPLPDVLSIGEQLCEVLHYLHSQYPPIIFRDVKPANIMRAPDGTIYLIDFGVARRFKAGRTKDTVPFGSPGYAPLEQFGRAQTTPRSDVYSLGVTLYELLSGHEPEATAHHHAFPRSLKGDVPAAFVSLLTRMLEDDTEKRPASMLEVQQKLREIAAIVTPLPSFSSFSKTPAALRATSPAAMSARRTGIAAGLALLFAVCLLLGGLAGNSIGASSARSQFQREATGTALAATSTPNISATATVSQLVTQALAHPDPYPPAGTLAVFDPLNRPGAIDSYTNTDWGGNCQFKDEGFQLTQTKPNRFYYCTNEDTFANFTIEVKMTIVQGDCGGIVYRNTGDTGKTDVFFVCADGTYEIDHYLSDSKSITLSGHGTNTVINKGAIPNFIAVVAQGGDFDFYVNHHKIDSVGDPDYLAGTFGLLADDHTQSTTVSYQDLAVWKLP